MHPSPMAEIRTPVLPNSRVCIEGSFLVAGCWLLVAVSVGPSADTFKESLNLNAETSNQQPATSIRKF